ncbi:hypothetical protein F5B20DRAFT_314131 [Whalleya microplaca]|nr:hypothetical protein F5B20DRAFT_314131 [Whalleya microplaca]
MSRTTPRKYQNRPHQNQPSFSYSHSHSHSHSYSQQHQPQYGHIRNRSQQIQAEEAQQQLLTPSDYESDTANYMASHPPSSTAALAARTNTELNLSVLKRYLPSITNILSIAANAVVYTFTPPASWHKTKLEGTFFVCAQGGQGGGASGGGEDGVKNDNDNGCLFILNRKGPQNLILDLNNVGNFEVSANLLIFKLDKADEVPMENEELVTPDVLGVWIYTEDEQDRQTSVALIYEMWSKVRVAREQRLAAGLSGASPSKDSDVGPAMQAMSRRVSLTDLFAQNGGGGRAAA